MLTVRATLINGHLEFQPSFVPPSQPAAVLVTFMEDVARLPAAPESPPPTDFGAQFHWDEALELTKNVGGTPMSQIVI